MKTLSLLFFILAINVAHAQKLKKSDISPDILSRFSALHPIVQDLSWYKKDTIIEATFKETSTKLYAYGLNEMAVRFHEKGNLLETEEVLQTKAVPKEITAGFEQAYPKKNMREVTKIYSSKGVTTYKVTAKGLTVLLDSDGKVLNEIKEN